MYFNGTYEELKEKLKTLNGSWNEVNGFKVIVFRYGKAIMNWFKTTGTLNFQGDPVESHLLREHVKDLLLTEQKFTENKPMKTTNIIVKFQIEGIHNWPNAKDIEPEVAFLSDLHRHIFHITCKKKVTHSDRDVEIILFKRSVVDFLQAKYGCFQRKEVTGVERGPLAVSIFQFCNFESMSCEMIAEELVDVFDLTYCEVLEDNENGACVEING